ncbi:MAG: hypothetical protein K1X92_10340 [Bacteroidia bacterium]|nr:hypothetical protein [Bacteroidia bacterium]
MGRKMNNKNLKIQLKDIDYVQLILEAYGWAESSNGLSSVENQAEAGYYTMTENTKLIVSFHEPLNLISLQMDEINSGNSVKLHFMYDNKPQRILEWIVSVHKEINMLNYAALLKTAIGKCEMMLLELKNKKIYEVIPPSV